MNTLEKSRRDQGDVTGEEEIQRFLPGTTAQQFPCCFQPGVSLAWQDMVYGNGVAPSSPLGSYFEVRMGLESEGHRFGYPKLDSVTWKLLAKSPGPLGLKPVTGSNPMPLEV